MTNALVEHYTSVSVIEVNAKSLLECICNCFARDDIPFDNLVSDLSDITNYMRWKKGGLEPLLREKAPQLLDIDGDNCHHIHNTVKQFCLSNALLKSGSMTFIGTQSAVQIF